MVGERRRRNEKELVRRWAWAMGSIIVGLTSLIWAVVLAEYLLGGMGP